MGSNVSTTAGLSCRMNFDDPAGDLIYRMSHLRIRVLIVRRAGHAGIAVVQKIDGLQAKMLRGAAQLGLPQFRDRVVALQVFGVDGAGFAASCAHQMHMKALAGIQSQRTAHPKRFIIRMSQHGQQRSALNRSRFLPAGGIAFRPKLIQKVLLQTLDRRHCAANSHNRQVAFVETKSQPAAQGLQSGLDAASPNITDAVGHGFSYASRTRGSRRQPPMTLRGARKQAVYSPDAVPGFADRRAGNERSPVMDWAGTPGTGP